MEKLSVIIPAHDSHRDIVLLFRQCLEQFWKDCPYQIYWTNCKDDLQDEKILTIHNGEEAMFAQRVLSALSVVDTEYVLLWLEDFLPTKEIHTKDIEAVLGYMGTHQSNYCALLKTAKKMMHRVADNPCIYTIEKNLPYGISVNCGIFRRTYLASLIKEKSWNVWEIETSFLQLAAAGQQENCIYLGGGMGNMVNYLYKGKVNPSAAHKLKKVGIDLTQITRETLPTGQMLKINMILLGGLLCPVGVRGTVKRIAVRMGIRLASEY